MQLPRRTARLRLAALCGGLFLVSGVALLAGTYVLFERATAASTPQLPRIPSAPSLEPLRLSTLPQAMYYLAQAQHRLVQDQHTLSLLPKAAGGGPRLLLGPLNGEIATDQRQLTNDQHRLSQAVAQLTSAVHEIEQNGSAQAVQRSSDSHHLLVDSGIALAVVGVLALLAGWLLAGRMLRPIRTITRTARRISSSNLHERLALDGPEDELKELSDTLDDLFARLEAAFEAQRRFVAHASHELRTPLTRERALVQVALGDPSTSELWKSTGEELLASNREQETLIDALLTLASSERGLDGVETVDLADLCGAVLNRLDTDLEVAASLHPALLDGDPRLVERLVANLIDNAVEHNVGGGRVQISTGVAEGRAVLMVGNSGPAVPAGELDRLFQPFQRLSPGRGHYKDGHGLGLSIVRAIATAHDATITAQAPPAGGLSVSVAFPPV